MTSRTSWYIALPLAFALTACGDDGSSGASATAGQPTSASAGTVTVTTNATGGGSESGTGEGTGANSSSDSNSTASPTTGADTTAAGTGQPTSDGITDGTTGGVPKLDVGTPDTGFETSDTEATGKGCTAVDLLFVVDNSVSMGDYQNALSLAFPGFADAIVDSLPPGTSLHVGVTSTTMGDSNSGATSNCKATGDGGQPQEYFYQTPDKGNNGINGAQGRLYKPGNGPHYYTINTDATPAEIADLKTWFAQAAKVGESGSQVEMSAAAAGWVADPANAATNGGFIRDAGAVFVLFIVQDEADQTPWTIDGQPGGLAMLDKLAAAKAVCGGAECMIGGGFVNTNCLNKVPLGDLLGNLGAPPVVAELPDDNLAEDFPEQAAEQMNQLLRDSLTAVIAQKCDEIPPPK